MAGDWIFSAANQRIRLLKCKWQMESAQVGTRGNWQRVLTARVSLMSSALASLLSLSQVERPGARAPPTHNRPPLYLFLATAATTQYKFPNKPSLRHSLISHFSPLTVTGGSFGSLATILGWSHMVQLPGLTWRKFTASPCFPKNVTTPKCLEEKLLVI